LEVVEAVGQRALRSSGEVVVAALIAAALTDDSATQRQISAGCAGLDALEINTGPVEMSCSSSSMKINE
jgi:hypothetical protein